MSVHVDPEGYWDDNCEDFTFKPDVRVYDVESWYIYHAIFGFSAGFPDCCVIQYLRTHPYHKRDEIVLKREHRPGLLTLTHLYFALCPADHDREQAVEIFIDEDSYSGNVECSDCRPKDLYTGSVPSTIAENVNNGN